MASSGLLIAQVCGVTQWHFQGAHNTSQQVVYHASLRFIISSTLHLLSTSVVNLGELQVPLF